MGDEATRCFGSLLVKGVPEVRRIDHCEGDVSRATANARRLKRILPLLALCVPSTVAAQISSSAFTHATRYDAARRVTGTIAPDPGGGAANYLAVRNTYDPAGRLIRVESGRLTAWQSEAVAPQNWSGFDITMTIDTGYDVMDRKLIEKTFGGGTLLSVTQWKYDARGLPECTAVRMDANALASPPTSACELVNANSQNPDRIERNEYDAADQLSKVIKGHGTALRQDYAAYTYTANGKRASVTDANGNRAEMTYDGFDRQKRWIFPSAATRGQVNAADYEEYGWDANGNRTSLRKRDERRILYAYDALNRVQSKTYPDGGARGVYYAYDLRGLQTAARFDTTSGSDAVLTSYNGFGDVSGSTTAMRSTNRSLSFDYDADGNRTLLRHPDGSSFTYGYDGLDRVKGITQTNGAVLADHRYDRFGRLDELSKPGGMTQFGYDGIGRLTGLVVGHAGGPTYSFMYNPASQVVSDQRNDDAYAWKGATNVDRGYVVNGLNQYSQAGGVSLEHDRNGNLKTSGSVSYGYDVENRLVTGPNQATLEYDPLGRLWQVTTPATATSFLYDRDRLTLEYGSAGQVLRRYVHDVGIDEPLIWYEGANLGDMRLLQRDRLGSVVQIVGPSDNLLAINSFDEYGLPNADPNSTPPRVLNIGRFQYTGQIWLPELNLYHYKARFYSANLGRFLQTDPIGYDDQMNLYAYVANDPVNNTDPSGECAFVCGAVIGAAIDGGIEAGTQLWNDGKVSDWGAVGSHALTGAAIGAATGGIGNLVRAGRAAQTASRVAQAGRPASSAAQAVLLRQNLVRQSLVGFKSELQKGGGKVMAGAGAKTGRAIDDVKRLVARYGGKEGDWAKITSPAVRDAEGRSLSVHGYRNVGTGRTYEFKIKAE